MLDVYRHSVHCITELQYCRCILSVTYDGFELIVLYSDSTSGALQKLAAARVVTCGPFYSVLVCQLELHAARERPSLERGRVAGYYAVLRASSTAWHSSVSFIPSVVTDLRLLAHFSATIRRTVSEGIRVIVSMLVIACAK